MQRLIIIAVFLFIFSLASFAGSEKGRVYYFFSFSVPEESLVQAMRQAQKLNATMVLRGLKNDNWNVTLKEILTLSQKAGVQKGAIIDPTLFDDFDVRVVPAVVYQCEDGSYYKVSGNIPVQNAMEIIFRRGDPCED
jgi:conjugal transfer pilus assembly protein TrbC